jgi:pimeloyl-ACP methyl ester carboxylesterase
MSERVTVNGVDLAYEVHGTLDDGAIPLLLVHGFTGSRLDWVDVIDRLATARPVVAYDHRGHGESTNTADTATYTFAQLTADLEAFVGALGLAHYDLLGHSMGGMVALRHMATNPPAVRSLLLMDTSASPLTGAREMFTASYAVARERGMAAVFAMMEPFLPDDGRGRELKERIRTKYDQMDPVAFCALGAEISGAPSVAGTLPAVAVPTTVIVGEDDTPFRAPSDEMAAGIPGARLVVVPGAAHCPQEDDPSRWCTILDDHFARLAAVAP